MRILTIVVFIFLNLTALEANADAYMYPASCDGSYSKQGEQTADLTTIQGQPVRCDNIVFALLDNGRVSVQVVNSKSNVTPLGFSGGGLDYESNDNFVTVHLDRISLPHTSSPGVSQSVDGIEGYCFIEGKFNLRSLTAFVCTSKMEIGTQKLVYTVKAHIKGLGQRVPGL